MERAMSCRTATGVAVGFAQPGCGGRSWLIPPQPIANDRIRVSISYV